MEVLRAYATQSGISPILLAGIGVAFGLLLLVFSVASILRDRARAKSMKRLAAEEQVRPRLVRDEVAAADGVLDRVFVPVEAGELDRLKQNLADAGLTGERAALMFNLFRFGIGLVLPGIVSFLTLNPMDLALPPVLADVLKTLPANQIVLIATSMIVVGFYGPTLWLSGRVAERRQRIEQAFPNALDLLQVGVEAGLAFDAALSRVADELEVAAPDLCRELRVVQTEIQAGRPREAVYKAMADRLRIDEAQGFANVVLQSMKFGTSMSSALLTYSAEMRQRRELLAQEKANRLPVLMSGVMAALMMPALLIVTIGPVVLRFMAGN